MRNAIQFSSWFSLNMRFVLVFSARSNWSHFRRLLCVLFMSPWHLLQSFPKIGQLPEGRSLVPKALRG